jgi:AcrR family transcriptional regulator
MARPRGDIDSRILRAARQRFLIEGVDGASLRAVARDAGTSIGMIYYYFPTKEELFHGVVEEVYQRVLRDIESALGSDLPVKGRILRLYERIGRLDSEELDVLRLVIREALVSSERRERLLERFQRGHFPIVVRTILDGLADGTLERSLHPLVVLSSVIALGALPPVIVRLVGGRLPLPGSAQPEDLPKQLVTALFRGIGTARPEEGPPRSAPTTSPPRSGRGSRTLKGARKKPSGPLA